MLYYKVCRSYKSVLPSPVLVRDPMEWNSPSICKGGHCRIITLNTANCNQPLMNKVMLKSMANGYAVMVITMWGFTPDYSEGCLL